MSTSYVILLPNGEPLVLTEAELERARRRGNQFRNVNNDQSERLISAAALAEFTSLPQSWLEEAARQGRIPCVTAGKYRRFRPSAVIAALERDTDAESG